MSHQFFEARGICCDGSFRCFVSLLASFSNRFARVRLVSLGRDPASSGRKKPTHGLLVIDAVRSTSQFSTFSDCLSILQVCSFFWFRCTTSVLLRATQRADFDRLRLAFPDGYRGIGFFATAILFAIKSAACSSLPRQTLRYFEEQMLVRGPQIFSEFVLSVLHRTLPFRCPQVGLLGGRPYEFRSRRFLLSLIDQNWRGPPESL